MGLLSRKGQWTSQHHCYNSSPTLWPWEHSPHTSCSLDLTWASPPGSWPLWRQCHLPRPPHQNHHRANPDSSFSLTSHAPWSLCPIKFSLCMAPQIGPPSLFPLHILGEGSYRNSPDNSKSSSGSPCLPTYSPLIGQSESFQNITPSMSCSHLKALISTLTPYHLWQLFPKCGANMKLF